MSYADDGLRVLVRELGETPLEAIEEHLLVERQPPPDPDELGADEVVIEVRAAGVGWVDLIMASGQYQHVPEPPYTPGVEFAGTLAWKGAAVEGWSLGDEVLVDGLLTGPRSLGRHRRWGGFASFAVAPAAALIRKPAGLDFDQASVLLAAYETAYHCLIYRGRLRAGDVVLVHGASGSTGLAAVHLAKLSGAIVIATGRSPDKLDVVLAQGADHAICTGDEGVGIAGLRDAVKALTSGRGVDVVFDPVGGPISVQSMRCVAFGARFLVVGWAATPFVAKGKGGRGAPNANQLPTNLIMMKSLDVLGCPAAISAHRDPRMRAERLQRVLGWAERGAITPHVAATFPLSRVADAMRAKWMSEAVGGIVLRPTSA